MRDRSIPPISLCVPFVHRTDALRTLLESLPDGVEEVVIGDNGELSDPIPENIDTTVTIEHLDLSPSSGIGAARRATADAATHDYLLVADVDMVIPESIHVLIDLLERQERLGGVGGILIEHGELRSGCTDFHDCSLMSGKRVLVQNISDESNFEWTAGMPFARFDKLANCMMVRSECVEDYSWDPNANEEAHLDWFVGQWKETNWEFAICPEVVFKHNPSRSSVYRSRFRQPVKNRSSTDRRRLCAKWGYADIVWENTRWFGTDRHPLLERLYKEGARHFPTKYTYPIKRTVEKVIRNE